MTHLTQVYVCMVNIIDYYCQQIAFQGWERGIVEINSFMYGKFIS